MNILVIDSRYHPDVAETLVDGATAALEKGGARFGRVSVPGVLELPAAIALAARSARPFDAYVALGSVTGHPNIASTLHAETLRGLVSLSASGIALGIGLVLAADEGTAHDLAVSHDVGGEAGRAAVALATLATRLGPAQ